MLSTILGVCKTLGKLVWISPALLRKRNKALVIFQVELYAQGVDHEAIKELTTMYKGLGDFRTWT